MVLTLRSCVFYWFPNKQRLLPYAALTDWSFIILIFYHRFGECSLSVRTESLYKTDTFVCKGECRHNDMIVIYTAMSALPVTLCSSSVCGTVFKFILGPCYIHLVGSVLVNGHQNVSETYRWHRSVCLKWFQNNFFPCRFFTFPLSNLCQTHVSRKYENRPKILRWRI
jgi:hypothetical protein